MKRTAVIILLTFGLGLFAAPAVAASKTDDFKAFQKAVKKNPAYEKGREARWLKILIMDSRGRGERVRISLPLAIVDVLLNCSDSRHFKVDDGDCEIDLKALFRDLKKAGPAALIEIRGEEGILKIWLE